MHQPRHDPDAARRRELATFLRAKREARSPAAAGLADEGRRRTPGLRREEVASLAGVSATWLTWAEQAREVQLSDRTVRALARALALTLPETEYVARLARRGGGEPALPPLIELDPVLRRYVEEVLPHPAYVLGPLFELLAWNPAAEAVFTPFGALPLEERNFLRFYFTDTGHRARAIGWEEHARLLLSKFRALYSRQLDNPRAQVLLAELSAASPEFAAWWKERNVNWVRSGQKLYVRVDGSVAAFEFLIFQPDLQPDIRVAQLLPAAP